jgi:hypothetical protein
MVDDLHRAVWLAYRQAMRADVSWEAAPAFQAAVDVLLRQHPEIAAEPACRLTVRMIMMPPRGFRSASAPGTAETLSLTVRRAPR